MKKRFLIYVLCALTVCAAVIFSSCGRNEEEPETWIDSETLDPGISFSSIEITSETEAEIVPVTEPETEPVTEPVTEYIEPVTTQQWTPTPVEDGAFSGCLFIGDSRTEGLEMVGVLDGADVFATTGLSVFGALGGTYDTVAGVGEVTLTQLLSMKSYNKVYILLGINEIGYDHSVLADKNRELADLVRSYQPGAKIIFQANLHVTTARSNSDSVFNNANVNSLNDRIRALTNGSTILWIDPNTILDDSTGGLSENYAAGDGIHLDWNSYTMWGEWIAVQNAKY